MKQKQITDITMEVELNRKCQCQDMKDAQESGTDNEGYSSLIKGKHIGSGLPDISFCPWCGGDL